MSDKNWKHKQLAAVQAMISSSHTILVAREHKNWKRRYQSFSSLATVRKWMSSVTDGMRNAFMVDLSAWDHLSLTDAERQYIRTSFVSPFMWDVEWLSVDGQPDPLARDRMDMLCNTVTQVLEMISPRGIGAEVANIEIEDLSRKPKGKKHFKNSYQMVVPDAVFEHNAKGCMCCWFQR